MTEHIRHDYQPEAPQPFSGADRDLIGAVMETDIPFDEIAATPPDIYDERREICKEVLRMRDQMLERMFSAASAAGIEFDLDLIDTWEPSQMELQAIRRQVQEQRKRMDMINGLSSYATDQVEAAHEMGVHLRPYQLEPVEAFHEFMIHAPRNEHGGKSGIIEMPTGTGKTAIFANLTAQLKHGERADDPVRVLVLVPTQPILVQTLGAHGERGFGKFAPHLNVGAYYQRAKDLSKEVVVMTVHSFNRLMAEDAMPHFSAVVVDEAHTVIGDVVGSNLTDYMRDKVVIGLTATPDYDESRSAYNIFEHRIYQASFKDSVHAGRLAPVRGYHWDAEPEIDPEDLPDNPTESKRVMRAARLAARMKIARGLIEKAIERGVGVLVRCPPGNDIEVAVNYAEEMREYWYVTKPDGSYSRVEAWPIGGSTRRQTYDERQQINQAYDFGDVEVLTYVKAIGMGWDSPFAKEFIDLSTTTSAVEMRQQIGRIMRLSLAGPDRKPVEAIVHTFRDPDLGAKQYSCLDALESKQGELITHEEVDEEVPIPVPRRFRRAKAPEIISVQETVVGELALEHAVTAVLPNDTEVNESIAALTDDSVTIDEAARILCLDITDLRNILRKAGSNPKRKIPKEELGVLLELYPDIVPPDLPATNYISLPALAAQAKVPARMLSVLAFGRKRGIEPWRFRHPEEGIGYYYSEEEAAIILSLMDQGAFKLHRKKDKPK